jgi:hypothetical protein
LVHFLGVSLRGESKNTILVLCVFFPVKCSWKNIMNLKNWYFSAYVTTFFLCSSFLPSLVANSKQSFRIAHGHVGGKHAFNSNARWRFGIWPALFSGRFLTSGFNDQIFNLQSRGLLLMISEGRPARGGKSPRSRILETTALTGQKPLSKKPAAKKPAAKNKKPAKHRNAVNKGCVSPCKGDWRTHEGARTSSTGLLGQEIPEVSYPTDLSDGYKTGPECRKKSTRAWNRQQMAQW